MLQRALSHFGTMTNKNGRRAPGLPYKIYHPNVTPPMAVAPRKEAIMTKYCTYIPNGYAFQQRIEHLRTGSDLGSDWPYNLLPISFWRKRRYNVSYNEIPADTSICKGVQFYPKLNVWCVTWVEDGRPRFRYFRVQTQGFSRAKEMAEKFRLLLEGSGRVDNRRTEKEKRIRYLLKKKERELKRKRFSPLSKGLF
jgi:AP2 domain